MNAALSSFLALLFVLGLMFALMWLVRRFRLLPGQALPSSKSKDILIRETKVIDPRNRLMIVEWNDKQYLLATGQSGVMVIDKDTSIAMSEEKAFKELLVTDKDDNTD